MSKVLVGVFVSVLLLADDVERIERIVQDVEILKKNYELCQKSLSEVIEKKEKPVTSTCKKVDNYAYVSEINLLKEENRQLKAKLSAIEAKPPKVVTKEVIVEKVVYKEIPCTHKDEQNSHQELASATKATSASITHNETARKKDSAERAVPSTKSKLKVKKKTSRAKTYRTNKEAAIYDSINGKVIQTFENRTSFTSNVQKSAWIKITGTFENRRWKPVKCDELWIKKVDADIHE